VRLLRWSTLLFVLASALCGMSTSLEMLIAARVLQGAVAGPMIPLSQAMLLAVYPPERRVSALSLWSNGGDRRAYPRTGSADLESLARIAGRTQGGEAYSMLERMLSSQSHLLGAVDFFWLTGWVLVGLVAVVVGAPAIWSGEGVARRVARQQFAPIAAEVIFLSGS
jgi:MFS family permease